MSWDELAEESRKSLRDADTEALRGLDSAFQHFFINEVRRGSEASRTEFIWGMLGVLESPEARAEKSATEIQQFLCRWHHLDALMDAMRRDGGLIEQAERFVRSKELAGRILDALAEAGSKGINAGELATQLEISQQYLSKLLRELEPHNIIERRSTGRMVYVFLGLVGQILAERRESGRQKIKPIKAAAIKAAESLPRQVERFSNDSRIDTAIDSPPRELLVA